MRTNTLKLAVFGMIVWFFAVGDLSGAGKNDRLLSKETYLEMESIRSPRISPDGTQILFTRGWVDKMEDRSRSNIWIVDIAGTRVRELTHGNWSDSSPVWSPDGKKIAFLSDRDGTDQNDHEINKCTLFIFYSDIGRIRV